MEDKNKYVSERIVNIAELETYIEKAYYVSERIVNIAELETYIEKAYISVELLADEIKQMGINNQQVIRLFEEVEKCIKKAKDFEFCIERRITQ